MGRFEQGERTKVIIDELDLMIIMELGIKPSGVLELTKNLDVQHKTIKNHIEKLRRLRVINIEQLPQNKKRLSLTKPTISFIKEYDKQLKDIFHTKK